MQVASQPSELRNSDQDHPIDAIKSIHNDHHKYAYLLSQVDSS
jgi:hypothetical protein